MPALDDGSANFFVPASGQRVGYAAILLCGRLRNMVRFRYACGFRFWQDWTSGRPAFRF